MINSRPLGCNPRPEGEPLCVQDLMLGRARLGQPEIKFETGPATHPQVRERATSKERVLEQKDKGGLPRTVEAKKMDKGQKKCQSRRHCAQKG